MSKITLLDGAMGTELRKRGVKVTDYKSSIWSAFALLEAPEAVKKLHLDYINEGAKVITVNNYAVTKILLKREKMEHRLGELTLLACKLACEAREESGKDVLIAGSLAPLNTTYRADLVGPYDEVLEAYKEMAAIMAPYVDIFLGETLSTSLEAKAVLEATKEHGKPTWISWTLKPTGYVLRGGESIEKAVFKLEGHNVDAFLLNCSATKPITQTIPKLRAVTDVPIGGYANPVIDEFGDGEPETDPKHPLSPEEYAQMTTVWVDAGATLIGGCCDTGPEFTKALRSQFKL